MNVIEFFLHLYFSSTEGEAYLQGGGHEGFGAPIYQEHDGNPLNDSAYAPVLLQISQPLQYTDVNMDENMSPYLTISDSILSPGSSGYCTSDSPPYAKHPCSFDNTTGMCML